jgi:RNA polymerase sigma factor (sigma-70 family)
MNMTASVTASSRVDQEYQMVQSAIQGSRRAYEQLVNRYKMVVYYHLIKMSFSHEDAEDLTQETFLKAFDKLESYEPHFAFSTWLFRIAINNGIDRIRRKRVLYTNFDPQESSSSLHEKLGQSHDTPEEQMISDQRRELVRSVIRKLDVKYQLMIELRFYEEKSYDDIANELGLPLGTVKAQIHRAKELLHGMLRKSNMIVSN